MKRSIKKLIVYILTLSMVLSVFSGCGEKSSDAAGTADKPETEAASEVKEAEAASSAGEAASDKSSAEEKTQEVSVTEEAAVPEEGLDALELTAEITEYYDEETSYGIEYESESEPTVEQQAEQPEGTFGEVIAEDVTLEPETVPFAPLSDEELEVIAAEVREEIEEKAQQEEDSGAVTDVLDEKDTENGQTAAEAGVSDTVYTANAPKQLTIEDIQKMNPDSVVIDIYTNRGYLSTLVGKFYEGKVKNVEDGVASIQPLASLLGLSKGCDFFAVYQARNNAGYTFYTYQQRYGGNTIKYATLKIIVDPEGYTAGLSCSFVPNIGRASSEPKITEEEAVDIVRNKFASFSLTYYTDKTVLIAVPFNNEIYNCWVVYTDNPDATPAFDMPYIEHYVTIDGEYLTLIPANHFATSSVDVHDNSGYFEGMEVKDYTTSFKLEDGSVREITVPVSYNKKDKKYYLMDPSRKIAVAQYYDFNFRNTVNFVTSSTIDGWSKNNLMAYANYIIVYDFYKEHGIASVDGFGVPILITVGWCDKNRTPVNNACFYGVNDGWACFGVSDINYYSDCVDVIGHEYTHGITNRTMQGCAYRNESGSINESYSDIMGNLIEISQNYTDDRNWLIAEKTGQPDRNMSDPNQYGQPQYVGDIYYRPAVLYPDFDVNDYGGVHVNNSLVGHIAYLMDQAGMSYEQQISMWLTSMELINPLSDYQDLHGALLFSLKINGLLKIYGGALNQAFSDAGLNENWTVSYLEATKNGYGRVTFATDEHIAASPVIVYFANTEGKILAKGYPDANGFVSTLLSAGTYIAQMAVISTDGSATRYYNYTGKGWLEGGQFMTFNVASGDKIELYGTSTSNSGGGTSSSGELNLVEFSTEDFSILMPEGWKFEIYDQYAYFAFKMYDPNDPSTQLFYYGGINPYHKSEATKKFWSMYDGMITDGPVLPEHNILGILDTWNYFADYQQYYNGKQYFTKLYDLYVNGGAYYSGPYAAFGGIESACVAECSTDWDDDCVLTIASALVDEDYLGMYGGNWFYTAKGMCGVLAPEERYEDVFEGLLQCLMSLTFSSSYIMESQGTSFPMDDQYTISKNLSVLGNVLYDIYGMYG